MRHPGGAGRVDRGADVARPGPDLPVVVEDGEGLVHAAVVAVGEHQDPGSAGDLPGQPDRPPVGVGRRQRERPQRQAEPAGQLRADPLGVLGRQHGGQAAPLLGPAADRRGHRRGGMSRHRTGVAQREVGVAPAVHVGDGAAGGAVEVEREAAGPLAHPGHRHPVEQVPGLSVQRQRRRMAGGVTLPLVGDQSVQPVPRHRRHGLSPPGCPRPAPGRAPRRCRPGRHSGRLRWPSSPPRHRRRGNRAPCRRPSRTACCHPS